MYGNTRDAYDVVKLILGGAQYRSGLDNERDARSWTLVGRGDDRESASDSGQHDAGSWLSSKVHGAARGNNRTCLVWHAAQND
ncbi:hypothetical protein GGTG_10956 [Gaeumannomyces tritici R3-111a-1]|uniref:Uncharacterized protein n=1 Tax=Gaeumannomyces tritici (strain R3-111a-1) TaxID=644352 RepID=J3PBT5_GAET3|nr:hypothetical protein GGTG_10956 [Gaeumannomyces tritici R3-111a-1]EJT71702.1 hypothetical protein GGTG_10956 [Gaeumannomyces tritici R3-111a-1]